MHVVFVSREYPPGWPHGGVGTFTRALARAMAAEGCRVTVISCGPDHEESVKDDDGVEVHRVRLRDRGRLGIRFSMALPQTEERVRLARTAARVMRRLDLRPDVVEAPEWDAESLFTRWATPAPVVVHLHSPYLTLRKRRGVRLTADDRLAARLEWIAARRAIAVTAPSRLANQVLPGHEWLPAKRITRFPMPVDEALLADVSRRETARPMVLMCGRLDRLKAPETLVDALALLGADLPDVEAVFVGRPDDTGAPGGGNYGEWLAARAAERGVAIDIRGPQQWETVVDLYRQARVVTVPSRYESFSMVALEAMACGTAVVVSDACGIAETVTDRDGVRVIPPDDPAALAAAIRPLLRDADLARRFGEAGRRSALEHNAPRRVARARLDLYSSLGLRSRPE